MSLTISPIKGDDVLLCNGFSIYITYCDGLRYIVYRKDNKLLMFPTLQEAVAWCED